MAPKVKRGKVYKRGQCVEFVQRGQPYLACFLSAASARAFRAQRKKSNARDQAYWMQRLKRLDPKTAAQLERSYKEYDRKHRS